MRDFVANEIPYNFNDVPTIKKFYLSNKKIRSIVGPYGSGKSSGCVITLLRHTCEQMPDPYGVRRTRFVIIRNCYSDDTEILTEKRGWVLFKDLLPDDKVAQYNPVSGDIKFVKPAYYYHAYYADKMIWIHSALKGLDLLVTPDHKLYVSVREGNKWSPYKFVTAKDCYGKKVAFMSYMQELITDQSDWFVKDYKGMVYCVEVPTHIVLVRRNGKPVLCSQTYRQLRDTTKKTIDHWLRFAEWKESEFKYILRFRLPDNTIVESEWLLRALDRPEHIANLYSLEVTGAWINEAKEISKEIFDTIEGRLRYPPTVRDEKGNVIYGPTWLGILLDTNPPDTDHWFYKYFEEERPEKAEIFHQPSGLSPEAENIRNLPSNYYQDLCVGKDQDWIDVYVHGKYGSVKSGKPVFSLYNDEIHCAKEPLAPLPAFPLIIGMDFGLTPACVIVQKPPRRLLVLDEVVVEEPIDVIEFLSYMVLPFLEEKEQYRSKPFVIIGDPAGKARSQLDGRTVFQAISQLGLRAYPAYTNSIQLRLNAVNQYLTRLDTFAGELRPAFLLSPTCKTLRQALKGKYKMKRISTGTEVYSDVPVKNQWSHVADALQYACLGYTPPSHQNMEEDFSFSSENAITTLGGGIY